MKMKMKTNPVLILFLLLGISIPLSSALQHQTLFLGSLPQTHETRRSPQIDDINMTHDDQSFELISIDHLLSQQDPTLTPEALLSLRLQRDLLRVKALSSARASGQVISGSDMGSDTYFMTLGVGSPPKYVYMSLETGSDIIWLQCSPCKKCYNQSDPIFSPRNSTTYSQIACGDPRCSKQLQFMFDGCGGRHRNTCFYSATYADGSFTRGTFSTETLTLGRTTKLRNISLGCGHDNQGLFAGSAGSLGLGRGSLSFITQTKDQFKSQFSYCLAFPFSNTSKSSIAFGPSAVPTRKADVYYTPLIYTNTTTTFYYVNLTGISVGGARVPGIRPSVFDLKPNGDGGVIMDPGTTFTQLVKGAYVALRKAFQVAFQKLNPTLVRISSKNYLSLDTCYNISRVLNTGVNVPTVDLHFDGGANMSLWPDNVMVLIDFKGTYCLAFMSIEQYSVIGNIQQQGIRIVYDVPGSRLGFVPEAC